MVTRTLILTATISMTCVLGGCHSPGGAFMSYTGGSQTFVSRETRPVTVEMIDLRNDQVVFRMDVPAGKQLTFDFVPGEGDDPVYTPDLMRYQVWDIGTDTGRLRNSLTVPPASSLRIDVHYRDGIEYSVSPPHRDLRTDELEDRPTWWTPEGGELPDETETGLTSYDG